MFGWALCVFSHSVSCVMSAMQSFFFYILINANRFFRISLLTMAKYSMAQSRGITITELVALV